MSAPLSLTSGQLRDIAAALSALSRIRADYDVEIGAWGEQRITHLVGDVVLRITVDDSGEYVIDDRIGD